MKGSASGPIRRRTCGLDVSALTRLRRWLLPIDLRAYRSIEKRLLERWAALEPPAPTRHASSPVAA